MKTRIAVLVSSLIISFGLAAPAIRADISSVLDYKFKAVQDRLTTLEKLPDMVYQLREDVAVLKTQGEESNWYHRGILALVAGALIERLVSARKGR